MSPSQKVRSRSSQRKNLKNKIIKLLNIQPKNYNIKEKKLKNWLKKTGIQR
jgi:hypothetical protein